MQPQMELVIHLIYLKGPREVFVSCEHFTVNSVLHGTCCPPPKEQAASVLGLLQNGEQMFGEMMSPG